MNKKVSSRFKLQIQIFIPFNVHSSINMNQMELKTEKWEKASCSYISMQHIHNCGIILLALLTVDSHHHAVIRQLYLWQVSYSIISKVCAL